MKRILVWLCILSLSVAAARAQDDATQQQINKLNGQIQDLLDAQAVQAKRIDALEKEISELRDKSNSPGATDSANADDLKKLADQIQEIDKKRQADKELILKEIEKLGKVSSSSSGHKSTPIVTTNPPAGGKQSGYEYSIQRGDTFLIIAKAYSEQGIKVTATQIQKANPGVDPKNLKVGQKIFIPAPAQ
jgi:nucleoid-associated protein YgaU